MRLVVVGELVLAALCISAEQLSRNIVTEEVKSRVVKSMYGKVQGFISKVGRDAATEKFVELFLGIPYASPPTGNYRYLGIQETIINTAPHQHPQMANYSLMDQGSLFLNSTFKCIPTSKIAALKWIQQNIKQFGGDSDKVTMFGYRKGASCIHFLMQSPAAVAGDIFII